MADDDDLAQMEVREVLSAKGKIELRVESKGARTRI